jgi:ATP-dependent phosphoenolpyruvate carboxykinase
LVDVFSPLLECYHVLITSLQHAHNLKTLIEKSGAQAYLVNTANPGAEEAIAAAASGKAPTATIKKSAVTADVIKRVSTLVSGHKAAKEILDGASESFV